MMCSWPACFAPVIAVVAVQHISTSCIVTLILIVDFISCQFDLVHSLFVFRRVLTVVSVLLFCCTVLSRLPLYLL